MLFVLTGGIQTGKTRWLGRLAKRLAVDGVTCAGVLAPGVWRRRDPGAAPSAGERAVGSRADSGYEKLGIDNVLLPGGERIPFARRADLTCEAGEFDRGSQSARAGLGWAIDDGAIERVNAHFRGLAARDGAAEPPSLSGLGLGSADSAGPSGCDPGFADPARADSRPPAASLLVVDELGRLELVRGEGLVEAMALLDRGPTRAFPYALIVVREDLLPLAAERFESSWDDMRAIRPDDGGATAVAHAVGAAV